MKSTILTIIAAEFVGRGRYMGVCRGPELGALACMLWAGLDLLIYDHAAAVASVALWFIQEFARAASAPFLLSAALIGCGSFLSICRVYEVNIPLPPRWVECSLRTNGLFFAFLINFWLVVMYFRVRGIYAWWVPWYIVQCVGCLRMMGLALRKS